MSSKKDKVLAQYGANLEESSGPAGMGAIVPLGSATPAARPARTVGVERAKDSAKIELSRLMPDPDQPRTEFDKDLLDELAESLKLHGQLQPIRVRWHEAEGKYMVIMGERRYRAAIRAALKTLDCVIEDRALSPREILELQILENAKREDLKPVEKAKAIRRLIDEYNYTTTEVGERLKMSQPAVSKALALLELAPQIQADVDSGAITKQAGYQISRAESKEAQVLVAEKVKAEGLTEEQTAEEVRKIEPKPKKKSTGKGRGGQSSNSKVKQELVWSDSGYKFRVECRKGIEPSALSEILLRKAEALASAG
jgi:ParB family chromosome partitioning protein